MDRNEPRHHPNFTSYTKTNAAYSLTNVANKFYHRLPPFEAHSRNFSIKQSVLRLNARLNQDTDVIYGNVKCLEDKKMSRRWTDHVF